MKSIRARLGGLALWLAEMRRKAGAWRWGSPIVRAVAAVLGLLVLAAIGRSALARGANRSHEIDPASSDVPPEPQTGGGFAAPSIGSSAAPSPLPAVPPIDSAL